jgi:hypothetical protein
MGRVRAELRRHWRWALVATGAAGLVVLPAVVAAVPVHGSGSSAAELSSRILASTNQPYEGYVEGHGGLRLPDLPGAADLSTLTSDTSRVRVWYAGPQRWRTDLLYSGGERDRYRTPEGLWIWDSGVHTSSFVEGDTQLRLPLPSDATPPDLARRILDAAKPSELSPLSPRRIAGHDGDGLRIVPASPASTIAKIDLWADTKSGLPLAVEVTAKGRDHPSFETSFLDLRIQPPDPKLVAFTPPKGSQTDDSGDALDLVQAIELYSDTKLPAELAGLPRRTAEASAAATYGTGFDVVAVLALPDRFVTDTLRALPASTRPWGHTAAVVTTPLVNGMLFAIDGTAYILGGPVTVKELDRVAAAIAAKAGS